MFDVQETAIPSVRLMLPRVARDARGAFVKILHAEVFEGQGLESHFTEIYYTSSRWGSVRGMHFQIPPHQHAKLVHCVSGRVLDVVLDLRLSSPTFKRHLTFELNSEVGAGVYIPPGCAHGFATLSEEATLLYMVTSMYDAGHDRGVRWDSIGAPWPVANPIISSRDAALPELADFDTPFA